MNTRPNIVYFFADELRQDALGCYNQSIPMKTPNIDRIASNGTLYRNCFCNSPICVPSRAVLLSGKYPEHTGIYGNEAALPSFHMDNIPKTLPRILEENGYITASFGKTHVPKELDQFMVNNKEGGEMSLGLSKEEKATLEKLMPKSELSINLASLYPDGKEYEPEKITKNAIEWIKKQEKPFFIRLSYLQPHSPIILKRGYENIYDNYFFKTDIMPNANLSEFERIFGSICGFNTLSENERKKAISYYYAMASWLDTQIGEVLTFLENEKLLDNTIIVVNSDHGALRGECGGGLGKHVFNRNAQAVPLIISTPNTKKGIIDERLCSNIDLPPTLLDLVGIETPKSFEGQNLNKETPPAVYGTIGYGEKESRVFPMRDLGVLKDGSGWPRRSCIRKDHYRLDMNTRINGKYTTEDNEDLFFVDIEKYPNEDVNQASSSEYRKVIKEMKDMLLEHIENSIEVPKEFITLPKGLKAETIQ